MSNIQVKSGYKTTEFWLTILVSVVGALFAAGVIDESIRDALYALLGSLATIIAYVISRAVVKSTANRE